MSFAYPPWNINKISSLKHIKNIEYLKIFLFGASTSFITKNYLATYFNNMNAEIMFPNKPLTATIHWKMPSTQNSTLPIWPQSFSLNKKKFSLLRMTSFSNIEISHYNWLYRLTDATWFRSMKHFLVLV